MRAYLSLIPLLVVASLLVAAAANPVATNDILNARKRAADKAVRDELVHRMNEYWADQYRFAESGDADAQYRVGGLLLKGLPELLSESGLEPNPVLGEALIRKAAAQGHPMARFRVWELDGGSFDEIVSQFREGGPDQYKYQPIPLRQTVAEIAIKRCDYRLHSEIEQTLQEIIRLYDEREIPISFRSVSNSDPEDYTLDYIDACGS